MFKTCITILISVASRYSFGQNDSLYLFIDDIQINSSTEVLKTEIYSTSDTLLFSNPHHEKLIGLAKGDEFFLRLITNSDTLVFINLESYLSNEANFKIYIEIPEDFDRCLNGTFIEVGGNVLIHDQMYFGEPPIKTVNCVMLQAGPSSYGEISALWYLD